MPYLSKWNPLQAIKDSTLSLLVLSLLLVCSFVSAQNCIYRPTRLTSTDPLCQKLITLATSTNRAVGVTKLANATRVNNLALDSIVTEMNLWAADSNRIRFLEDIMDISTPFHVGNHIDSINVRMVRGWKMIYDSIGSKTVFKKDLKILQALDTILRDTGKIAAFVRPNKSLPLFLSKYSKTRCTVCGNAGLIALPRLDSVLMNTAKVFQVYRNVSGFFSFYDREVFAHDIVDTTDNGVARTTPSIGQDGAQHQIKYMVDFYLVNRADTIDALIRPSKSKTDLRFVIGVGNPNTIRFIECKSYKDSTSLSSEGNLAQMKAYLAAIQNMRELRYVFNAKKTTLTQARDKMQKFFNAKMASVKNADVLFDAIWGNASLSSNLFPGVPNTPVGRTTAKSRYDLWIANLDNTIFEIVLIN